MVSAAFELEVLGMVLVLSELVLARHIAVVVVSLASALLQMMDKSLVVVELEIVLELLVVEVAVLL